ncbi:MAG: 7-cyano-7-deazaguanine synthase [Planctomycetia bacterium]|nr:7-cyano-7-deazaguanine synthase [Planctomycetia bacterium]
MISRSRSPVVGLLVSGGLDSAILLGDLLEKGREVQPFYIRAGLFWERHELAALTRLLAHFAGEKLRPLVVLEMPLTDVYHDHWSVTGRGVPDGSTSDDAVYLPGRNALLLIKAALWCSLNGVDELAMAPLGSNPFSDATPEFFEGFQAVLNVATAGNLLLSRPFAPLHKSEVMQLGRSFPLDLTFSCIAPVGEFHCGGCNKCAERRQAFASVGIDDPTTYAATAR